MIYEAWWLFIRILTWMSGVACGLVVAALILLAGYVLLYGLVMRVIRMGR